MKTLAQHPQITGPKLIQFLHRHFEVVPGRSNPREVCIRCPLCGDATGNRHVEAQTGLTNCWRCPPDHKGGLILPWMIRHGLLPADEDLTAYVPESDPAQACLELERAAKILAGKERPAAVLKKSFTHYDRLPAGFTLVSDNPESRIARRIITSFRAKNLAVDDISDAVVGYTVGDDDWSYYALVPIFYPLNRSRCWHLLGWQGRLIYPACEDLGMPAKKFPPGFPVSKTLYVVDDIEIIKPRVLIVVESILNVLSLRKVLPRDWVPIATFSAQISAFQAQLLHKTCREHSIQELVILLDQDATDKAWQLTSKLARKYFWSPTRLSVAEMPLDPSRPTYDPNDDVEAALKGIEKRRAVTPENVAAARLRLAARIQQSQVSARQ